MEKTLEFFADRSDRIDKIIAEEYAEISRSLVQQYIAQGRVFLAGKQVVKSLRTKSGDAIRLCIPAPEAIDALPEDIPFGIVYEDASLLVVNKPKGMVVHPAPGHYTGTLVNALLFHCGTSLSGIGGKIRPGIVHRIDKDTSGLLMVAKNDQAHQHLAAQIKAHSFTREYQAVVYGNLKSDSGCVDAPIGRNPKDRKQMAVLAEGRDARTQYVVRERFLHFSYLSLTLETGRTHQIRVHMASLGHPVAGDPVYGPKKIITTLQGQCLHAGKIGFVHPVTKAYLEFTAPLPTYFTDFLKKIRGNTHG